MLLFGNMQVNLQINEVCLAQVSVVSFLNYDKEKRNDTGKYFNLNVASMNAVHEEYILYSTLLVIQ